MERPAAISSIYNPPIYNPLLGPSAWLVWFQWKPCYNSFGQSGSLEASTLMSTQTLVRPKPEIEYPDSDGQPLSDNTLQFHWIDDRFDVEEYYVFDPHKIDLTGWIRQGESLTEIPQADGWTSPRLGVRFDLSSGDLQVFGPDGRPFATYVEVVEQRERERQRAQQEHQRAERLAAQLRALGVEPNG